MQKLYQKEQGHKPYELQRLAMFEATRTDVAQTLWESHGLKGNTIGERRTAYAGSSLVKCHGFQGRAPGERSFPDFPYH